MFWKLARFANKYKFFILAVWLVLTSALALTAPPLSKVGITDQSQFLPDSVESAYARDLLSRGFGSGSAASASSALVVAYDRQGLDQQDMDRARSMRDWLLSADAPAAVSGVTSPFDAEALRASMFSKDGTSLLIKIDMSVPALDDAAKQAVREIRARAESLPGTSFYVTGNVGLLYDLFDSVQRTVSHTTIVTVALVIVLLLLIYRSPVAALVPLLAIGCSFLVGRGIVGFLAQAGLPVSTVTDAFLVVTIFGVGTDYCLFIVSRFREELTNGDRARSLEVTMKRIGPIILASATTVIIAFLCLTISRFGMTRTSGWALGIGIAVTLAAGLTLVPALMSIFGRYLFWPTKRVAAPKPAKSGWPAIGRWVAGHPVLAAAPIIVALAIPYAALPGMKLSANVMAQIPQDVESARGLNVLRQHFPMGEMSPLPMLVRSANGRRLLTPDATQKIEKIARDMSAVEGVARIDYFGAPGRQLIGLGSQIRSTGDALLTPAGLDPAKLAFVSTAGDSLQALPLRYPGIVRSDSFTRAVAGLKQMSPMLGQMRSISPAELPRVVPQVQKSLYDLADALTALGNEFELNGNGPFVDWLKATYFSRDGTVTRINVVLKADPYSDASSEAVPGLRRAAAAAVGASGLAGVTTYIGGDAAVHEDMLRTSQSDFFRVLLVASAGILLVIIILLRSVLAPLYMVATVLFNFGATLGLTSWVLLGPMRQGTLIYLLPVFVFVMLAAVGADYNIFLVSRIREEAQTKPIREAVQCAVANTGGVITSCGIILAGTFATLATSPLPMVVQIGAPIAAGVLIDTFLVRALLVPSLAALAGRWSWWPVYPPEHKNKV